MTRMNEGSISTPLALVCHRHFPEHVTHSQPRERLVEISLLISSATRDAYFPRNS